MTSYLARLAVLHPPAMLAVCIAVGLTAGCPGEVPDAGPSPSPTPPVDAGEPDVVVDAGDDVDAGVDAGPTPLPIVAQRLCIAFLRGQAQAARDAAARIDARCSATDLLPNITGEADATVFDVSRCLPGRAEHQVFLSALEDERVDFDLAALERCAAAGQVARGDNPGIGAEQDRSTALASALATSCDDVITPLASVGDSCAQAWDCPASAPCQADPRDSQGFRCLAPAALGEPCLDLALPSDLEGGRIPLRICESELSCFAEVCTERLALGAFCDGSTVACSSGLVCGAGNFCVAPGVIGATCDVNAHCDAGLICGFGAPVGDGGVAPGRECLEPPADTRIADSEPCTPASICAGLCSVCRPDAIGSIETRCLDRGAVGEACAAANDCRQELFCGEGGICAPLRGVTESCDALNPCQSQLFCNEAVNACQLRPVIGNPCSVGGPDLCGEGFCINEICAAGITGDDCIGDQTCATDHLCVFTSDEVDGGQPIVARRCVASPRVGAPCTEDGRCEAIAFCDGERCRAFPGPGETCRNGVCAAGAFCDGEEEDSQCELARPPSSLCVSNDQCSSGYCLETGTCAALAAPVATTKDTYARFILLSVVPFALVPLVWRRRRAKRAVSKSGGAS